MADQLPQLDLSKSVPVNGGGATSTPQLPQLDLSKSTPVNGAAPIQAPNQPTISAAPSTDQKAQQFATDHPYITGAMESTPVAGVLTMPLVKGLINVHDKLKGIENLTQEGQQAHPIQAEIGHLANRIEGLLIGNEDHPEDAIGNGKYGMLTNPVTAAILPGSEGAPALAEGIEGGANLVKGAASKVASIVKGGEATAEGAEEAPGIVQRIKQVVSPKAAAQPGAQSALRAGAQASAADAGVTAEASTGGVRTLMDKPIAAAAKVEDGLYQTVNDAAKTDMKSLYDRQAELQDAIEDPTNIGQKTALQKELKTTEAQIGTGEANVQSALGKDAPKLLDQAKAATQQRYAMENVTQKIFNNESVVSGNVEHGIPEKINVDSAIRQVENLDKPSKFAPRGTPTRLQQAFGEDGAKALKQGLYDAQKAGEKVMTRNKVIGVLVGSGVSIGTGYKLLAGE